MSDILVHRRPEAATRRDFIIAGFAAPLLLAGCSNTSPNPAADGAARQSAAQESDPGTVVALDDFAALTILALGVTPDLVYDAFSYASTAQILADAGVRAKPYGASLNLEELIAAEPDIVIGVSLPTTVEQKPRLEQFSKVAILDYAADWQTALRATAAALGRQDRARRIEDRIMGDIAALKQDLADAGHTGSVVSVLAGSTESPFSPPAATNLGRLITSLGLDRPTPQKASVSADAPFVDVSDENLDQHDGDVLYLMGGRAYPLEPLQRSPLYPRLDAVRANRVHEVSGEMWFGANPVSVQWVLDDIRATILDRNPPQAETSASSKLRELVTATS